MTPQLIVSLEARADMAEAIRWFRDISPHLAERFEGELETVLQSVVDHPEHRPIVYKSFRRALLRRFPYSVYYRVKHSVILVLAVIHQSRDESTWKRRIVKH